MFCNGPISANHSPSSNASREDRGEIGRIEILDATGRGYPSPIRLEH